MELESEWMRALVDSLRTKLSSPYGLEMYFPVWFIHCRTKTVKDGGRASRLNNERTLGTCCPAENIQSASYTRPGEERD